MGMPAWLRSGKPTVDGTRWYASASGHVIHFESRCNEWYLRNSKGIRKGHLVYLVRATSSDKVPPNEGWKTMRDSGGGQAPTLKPLPSVSVSHELALQQILEIGAYQLPSTL